jgi:hypothetical protein
MTHHPVPPVATAKSVVKPVIHGIDTSADGLLFGRHGSGTISAEVWHRKVIADMERWIANNPGVPLTQGKRR